MTIIAIKSMFSVIQHILENNDKFVIVTVAHTIVCEFWVLRPGKGWICLYDFDVWIVNKENIYNAKHHQISDKTCCSNAPDLGKWFYIKDKTDQW